MSIARAEIAGLPPDRIVARLLAHALIEQTQVAPRPELIERLIAQAAECGWRDVQVQLLHCRLLLCSLQGAGEDALRAASDEMISVAQSTADEILIGLALSARALFLTGGRPDEGDPPPAWPTGTPRPATWPGSGGGSRASGSPSCWSTSTTSRWSTTPSAIRRATTCSG